MIHNMARKRSSLEINESTTQPRRQPSKRSRISPTSDADSSAASSCSVSVDTALQSSIDGGKASSVSSLETDEGQLDPEDSSFSSDMDSEDSTSGEDEDEVENITIVKKPQIGRLGVDAAGDLQERLINLLPMLKEANEALEGGEGGMEDVDDDEPHIEMNLGLGVLEEQRKGDDSSDESNSEIDDGNAGSEKPSTSDGTEKDVLGKLMGSKARPGSVVQELT